MSTITSDCSQMSATVADRLRRLAADANVGFRHPVELIDLRVSQLAAVEGSTSEIAGLQVLRSEVLRSLSFSR